MLTYRTLDEGPAVLENQGPMRQLRRQVLQTVQWYDPQAKANVQITVVPYNGGVASLRAVVANEVQGYFGAVFACAGLADAAAAASGAPFPLGSPK